MDKLKFGVALPYGSARSAVNLAKLAEENGWEGVFLGDAIWCEDPMAALAAAAVSTHTIRLGTMLIPAPLRRPWKIASEALAVDQLSEGRMILGLGAGAVWMGWQAFPGEPTDTKLRAEMLDETLDILTLLFQRKQVDYPGKHFPLKLTNLDPAYYPPAPVQQPRIPLWVPGLWPRKKSMRRVLKADGIFPERLDTEGKSQAVTPEDVREMVAYIRVNRTLSTPFDVVASGKTGGMSLQEQVDTLTAWKGAGATWWVETLFELDEQNAAERIRQGMPKVP